MPTLTVWQSGRMARLPFEGQTALSRVLAAGGFTVHYPCGGRGACGKCAVTLTGDVSAPNAAERAAGTRLSCQAVLYGDCTVALPDAREMVQIELDGASAPAALSPMEGRLGAAVDIGTTTIALKLYDLSDGRTLAQAAMMNPQASVAADVMGRIDASLHGRRDTLQKQALDAIAALITSACAQAGCAPDTVDALVLAGNTTMLYLLTGRDADCLSHAPFEADCLFDVALPLLGRAAYLPPCMNAFVGADITCAALSCGMCDNDETALLADIGTNGELALWHGGALYVCSTAAGPAFEGVGISCGCASVNGAIDRVWAIQGKAVVHTIGGGKATGLCGSGLIDAIAVYLALGEIDETGAVESATLPLADGVALLPADVRQVQLAKAALAAGIDTLMDAAGIGAEEIRTMYIAGGFGSHLNVSSAAAIGLFPQALRSRVKVIGNAALAGASMLLLDRAQQDKARSIAAGARHVRLGGEPRFNEHYMQQIMFPEAGGSIL